MFFLGGCLVFEWFLGFFCLNFVSSVRISSAFRREDPLVGFLAKLENVRKGPLSELEGALVDAAATHKAALTATTASAEKQVADFLGPLKSKII